MVKEQFMNISVLFVIVNGVFCVFVSLPTYVFILRATFFSF